VNPKFYHGKQRIQIQKKSGEEEKSGTFWLNGPRHRSEFAGWGWKGIHKLKGRGELGKPKDLQGNLGRPVEGSLFQGGRKKRGQGKGNWVSSATGFGKAPSKPRQKKTGKKRCRRKKALWRKENCPRHGLTKSCGGMMDERSAW